MRQRRIFGRKLSGRWVAVEGPAAALRGAPRGSPRSALRASLRGALRGDSEAQELEELRAVEARGGRVERRSEQGARRGGRRLRGRVRGRGLDAQLAAADRDNRAGPAGSAATGGAADRLAVAVAVAVALARPGPL